GAGRADDADGYVAFHAAIVPAHRRARRIACVPPFRQTLLRAFVPDEVVIGASLAADPPGSLLEHDLRAEGAGVVRRGHDPPVGAGEADRDQVATARERQCAREGEEVAAFAERTDEVDLRLLALVAPVFADERDRMLGAVQDGPEKVVHAAVADYYRLVSGLLDVEDPRHEGADRADQVPAGLEDERGSELVGDVRECPRVGTEVGCPAAVVGDAETAAGVEVTELDA